MGHPVPSANFFFFSHLILTRVFIFTNFLVLDISFSPSALDKHHHYRHDNHKHPHHNHHHHLNWKVNGSKAMPPTVEPGASHPSTTLLLIMLTIGDDYGDDDVQHHPFHHVYDGDYDIPAYPVHDIDNGDDDEECSSNTPCSFLGVFVQYCVMS